MTTQPIIESSMTFGPYPDGYCFHIENSTAYQKVRDGVPMAEFLLLRSKNGNPYSVWVVEAKSSAPQPGNKMSFDEYIEDIKGKLTNALSLGLAVCLKRHAAAATELPEPFKSLDLSVADFRLLLVIHGHQDAWLPPLKDALSKALRSTVKIWALSATAVEVINDSLARQYGLILANADSVGL